jgi:hypothetical protein
VRLNLKTLFLWILALLMTLMSAVYQRVTGPSYPVSGSVKIGDEAIGYELPRSHVTGTNAVIKLVLADPDVQGYLSWRRFKSRDEWSVSEMRREAGKLVGEIPAQPPAGKVMYKVILVDAQFNEYKLTDDPVIIRFRGPVPAVVLMPHILFMFAAMLLSTRAGLEALAGGNRDYVMAIWTSGLLLIGGIIFGPIVQKYAFGSFWTGWPAGHDLTDSKTAVALLFWIMALWRARNRPKGRLWIVIAAAITLLIFLIPHSLLGSELDYTKAD